MIRLTTHGDATARVDVAWRPGPVAGPFHGAWLPDDASLIAALDRVTQEHVRLLRDKTGWHLVLMSGETPDALSPWPLHRIGIGPFVFHPADVAPSPPPPDAVIGANLVGRVVEGRVTWSTWKAEDALSPADFLRLSIPSLRAEVRALPSTAPAYGSFPTFDSDPLPEKPRFEAEESRRLAALDDRETWWSRLMFWKRPPSAIEWSKLGQPGFLQKVLGIFNRQSSIFDRLAKLFERGDLDTALKHSIPIDNGLVSKLKNAGLLSLSWMLPSSLVDFSLGRLFGPGDRVASVAMDGGRVARLAELYRKAAERLSAEGRFRQAAYVYAHLLADFGRAAIELEKGGFHLEAAALLRQRMGNITGAAQVLERGGYVPEAVKLYLEHGLFGEAVQACEGAGMAEEAKQCLGLWLDDLKKRGLRIQAGDLYRDRIHDLARAREQYDIELRTDRGRRAEAGARLVELDELRGERELPSWGPSETILRVGLDRSGGFLESMKDLVAFHRDVCDWAQGRRLPEEMARTLHRRTRASLMEAIRLAQVRRRDEARGEAVAFLSTHLESGRDPLVVEDVRRNLGVGVGEAPGGRPAWKRRHGGIVDLDGLWMCWVRDRYALTDASGAMRTPVRRLPSLAVAMAKSARPDRVRIGMVSHDHRVISLALKGEDLSVAASGGVPGAVSIAEGNDYLVGTTKGEVISIREDHGTLKCHKVSLDRDVGAVTAMAWFQSELYRSLSEGPLVAGGIESGERPGLLIDNPLGSLTRLIATEQALIGVGIGLEFGVLTDMTPGFTQRITTTVPASGLTSLASLERPNQPTKRLALGYESGRIVIADLDAYAPSLRAVETFKTSLGPIVALSPLPFDRLLAIDLDFTCAILDLAAMRLEYQGPWEAAVRS